MSNKVESMKLGDWTIKLRPGSSRVILLLHGWTGDENSMWVFERQLPEDAFVIAPRAPFQTRGTELGGYSWVNRTVDFLPTMQDFHPAVYRLMEMLNRLKKQYSILNLDKLTVIGFSQGAAMGIALSQEFGGRVQKLAVLAGFLPDDVEGEARNCPELDVFVSHGRADNVVSVENAEKVRDYFKERGSHVKLCLAETGHRLGADCAPGLEDFLKIS